jgi:hypothetical protein
VTARLAASMLQRTARDGWWLPGLGATGPAPSLARPLQAFGRFVGDWALYPPDPGPGASGPTERVGSASFRWVLGGTAIQDVWGPLDARTGRTVPVGTTVRFYDTRIRAWRSTWLCPYDRSARRFVGRAEPGRIVLRELDRPERAERWIFSEITPNAFRWHAEARPRKGAPRRVIEEYRIRRISR